MTNLSWDDAKQYVAWLAKKTGKPYRLPSEAEWEYAARAGTRTRYSWGEELKPGQADCQGCGPVHDRARPTDLGSFPPNPWGLFDMEGNVAEWVEDCWHAYYRGAPTDGVAWSAPNCTQPRAARWIMEQPAIRHHGIQSQFLRWQCALSGQRPAGGADGAVVSPSRPSTL